MDDLYNYAAITTKIRAMSGKLLTDDDFKEIVSLSNVTSVEAYLKKLPAYQKIFEDFTDPEIHRGRLEFILERSLYDDFSKIYLFTDSLQRKFLQHYARRFEIKFLKKCVSNAFVNQQVEKDNLIFKDFFNQYTSLDLERLCRCQTIEEVLDAVHTTAYYPVLYDQYSSHADLFDYETALDLFHFRSMWDKKKDVVLNKNLDILKHTYGTKFDILNLWYIHRAKKYFQLENVDIYALTIPILYRLKKEEIQNLVNSQSEQEFQNILARTYYGRKYKSILTEELGDTYVRICKDVLRTEARENPYSIATVYYYLYRKEHEISRLTVAIECVRYQVNSIDAMKYVLKY